MTAVKYFWLISFYFSLQILMFVFGLARVKFLFRINHRHLHTLSLSGRQLIIYIRASSRIECKIKEAMNRSPEVVWWPPHLKIGLA